MHEKYIKEVCPELLLFYYNLFQHTFTNKNESCDIYNIINYMKNQWYKIKIIEEYDKIIAGVIFDYFEETNTIIIEYIVVDEKYRKRNIGAELIYNIIEEYKPDNILCEVDINGPADFWNRVGLYKKDIKYIQPKLSPEKEEVTSLSIFALNDNKIDETVKLYKEKCF